jgi:hypothetical protein
MADIQELARQKGGKCLSERYEAFNTKMVWQCENGHIWETRGKLGQTSTDFKVKCRKSARNIGIDHSSPGKTAPDRASSRDIL